MEFLNNFDCPQYVNFESEILDDYNVLKGTEASPSCSSDKDGVKCENMDTEEDSCYYLQDKESHPESLQSTFSESYLGNSSCQESVGSGASASYQTDDFPVNRPKNLSLPGNTPKKNVKVNKTTKVQHFHFMEGKKRKREHEDEDEHIPLAEQIVAFHKKTPQRFHTTGHKTFEPTEHWSPKLVRPKSPNLQAAKRRRSVHVLSREEKEEKEIEAMKGYRFRAGPYRRNLQKPHLPKVRRKMPTKPKDFNLRTAERAAEINAKKKEDEKAYEFHARPVPKAILNGPTGLKDKPSIPPTKPKTPNFRLKSRAEKWQSENKLNETTLEKPNFKALPAPAPSSAFAVKHEKKHTKIQPFSFDSKDKERMAEKEQKIKEEIEKENALRVFKAQLMPDPTPGPLPAVERKPPTLIQPFNFHLEGRSSKHNSFNFSTDEICPVFKAQPASVLEKPPFIPEKSGKLPVEVKEFNLHTEIRASERQKLKEINDIKEHEKELAMERLRQLQEEEERREVERLRKEAVHKANPIRHYKPLEIKPSSIPLTEPMSPKFKTNERLQMRH